MKSYKLKRFIGYFIYTLFIGYILAKGMQYDMHLKQITAKTYNMKPYAFFNVAFSVILGILMALPQFIKAWTKEGVWCFDWVRLISIGIPAFLLTITPLAYFNPPFATGRLLSQLWGLFGYSLTPLAISGVVFGYLLLSVIDKQQPE